MSQRASTTATDADAPESGVPSLVRLECRVQHYDWGSTDFIPSLLGIENPEGKPYAELWMGAHPDLPAVADVDGRRVRLDELIAAAPDAWLGSDVARAYDGRLPYLFKILSAGAPLSIQTHPSKARAREGFVRENAEGVPLDARFRNYRDENHKPELIVALTDFYGLRGFRPLSEIAQTIDAIPELRELPEFVPTPAGLQALYGAFMEFPGASDILGALVERLHWANAERPFTRDDPEYWVLLADRMHSKDGASDPGLLSIFLLNLVHLKPGEAMYLPAGVLHAYLEGSGVEIMANSNNVLRGGLTTKHVDVNELLANVTFQGAAPEIITPVPLGSGHASVYETMAREFELHRIDVDTERTHENDANHSADILLVAAADGDAPVTIAAGPQTATLARGDVLLASAGTPYTISAHAPATLFKATVPRVAHATTPTFRGRTPTALAFGTSGLRGLVTDITDLEAYINTRGFLDSLRRSRDVARGDVVSIAGDRRPSTDSPERSIMRAVARAIDDAGLRVDNLGRLPTPALMHHAVRHGHASVMITGSHIPFDRNGIKFGRTSGEILKSDEADILDAVAAVRREEYERPASESIFQDDGMLAPGEVPPLPPSNDDARSAYIQRYVDFFPAQGLAGKRIVLFQHSAVGRDLFVELLEAFGAEVHAAGRSEMFIAIDTEAVSAETLDDLQRMTDAVAREHGPVDAVVSTDGDSDRPLVCGVDDDGQVRFFSGDLLGIVVAEYLDADAVMVPISANDAVDLAFAPHGVTPVKTRIGSPYVIEAMQDAQTAGHTRVVGWEANGGFLLGSAITQAGRTLDPLPTRDAALPLLAALFSAAEHQCSLVERFAQLPARYSRAGLLDALPLATSHTLVRLLTPEDPDVVEVRFTDDGVRLVRTNGHVGNPGAVEGARLSIVRDELARRFTRADDFGSITAINSIDGVRIHFDTGDIAHIRPSGNAPQLRIYACASTQDRADAIVTLGVREPDGILRQLETLVGI